MKKFVKIISCFLFFLSSAAVFSQEALKSIEEEYYDFLALQGLVERPSLNYRTLSDSKWHLSEEAQTSDLNIWKNNNLGTTKKLSKSITFKFYGLEWFNSYNTKAPYGQNDGALWQGKGYNTSFSTGFRFEGYGFELTLKPQLSWSQNRGFELVDNSSYYTNKYAYTWGYGNNVGADAPQRFGDSSFCTFDWGDTEIRWSWHSLTTGFGTQAIWLGPAWLNPMLHSNNAATYPKFDIGLRKTEVHIPGTDRKLGSVEGRIWTGYLTESKYFDDDSGNDHNLIHGFTFSYAPSFLPGFTVGLNRTCLVKSSKENLKYIIPVGNNTHVGEQGAGEEQKFSFTADYCIPSVGFEVYGEIGTDDYAPGGGLKGYQRYFTHTMTYTVGAKKAITISEEKKIYSELVFEWNNTEMSQNYQLVGGYSFGFHYQITQGYTNRGQWLGSGIGYGGNSQHLEYRIYYPKGSTFLCIGRNNPDNNYIYAKAINSNTNETAIKYSHAFKANYYFGATTTYFITKSLSATAGATFDLIINPVYNTRNENQETIGTSELRKWNFELAIKYRL